MLLGFSGIERRLSSSSTGVPQTRCLSLTTLLGFLWTEDETGNGEENQTFFFAHVAVEHGVGRL